MPDIDQDAAKRAAESLERELAKEDECPKCLGPLDTGWECLKCGYDAMHLVRGEEQK